MSGSGTPGWPRPQGPPPSGPPPSGPPPSGPPPAGPPPYGQPTVAPTQFGQPPYGPPPGGFGGPPPPYGRPPRKRRWPLFLGLGLALLLVIGVAVTGWLYFSGRFGIGPLSAADKDAVAAITDGIDAPEWADEDQVECAVDDLIHESRSGELEKRGVIERDGDDWTYTGEWEVADATAYFEKLLDCSDDWADEVGETWQLEDTDCLEDIGTSTIGAYFARDMLTLSDKDSDDSAEEGHAKAVEELDACYAETPAAPKATAKPAYRAVTFTFEEPDVANGDVVISTGGPGNWTPLSGPSVSVDTEEGGKRGCVEAQAAVTYPWGTTSESQEQSCGTSKPKRIWWKKAKCTTTPGCYAWQLNYEGFKDYTSITARYTSNGGNCMAVSGACSDTIITQSGGRGRLVTWSFPASYNGAFVARIGKLSARIRN